jgi:PAS domain S-box-containing protein
MVPVSTPQIADYNGNSSHEDLQSGPSTTNPDSDAHSIQHEIAALRVTLHIMERRLQQLTGDPANGAGHLGSESRIWLEAREKLHQSEERFRGLFTTSATGIAISTPYGSYLQVNAAYCRMLGYSEDELKGLNFAAITHPEDLHLNLQLRDELLSGQRDSFLMEKRYLKKNGEILWARHSVSAARTSGGEIAALMVIAEDITERKLVEAALAQSEERLRLITNLVPHGIFAKDAAGRHLFANPALAELAGFSVEEMIGKDDFDLVADREQAERYRADDLAVMQSGRKMVIAEEPRTDLSGRTRFLQTIKIPFALAGTGEPAVLGVCMDITERKRTDARFRRLIDSNVQGVMFWNLNGAIVDANDALLRIIGYTREDVSAGRVNWRALTPPEHVQRDERAVQQLAEAGVCDPYEKDFIRQDGSRVPILIGSAVFEDNPQEGVCFVLDLTDFKKLEQQLLRAQRMESIGTLAGGIAHDLNNILTPILMSIDLLKGMTEDSGALEILDTIEASAERGADIVRQVLSFARGVEGSRIEIQPKRLLNDLETIIKDTFPKNIQLRFVIPEDAWTFSGDPTQMHQILLNLCVNARDAMPDGGSLTIRVENCILDEQLGATNFETKAGRYVNISVTDSGTGIPQNMIDKIFEMNKGTGLGLSTVLAIVKSHDGIVNVYSEQGKGTTFKVYLLALESPSGVEQRAIYHTVLPRGNGETILLVDDEAAILGVTGRALEVFGYRVLTAQDGAEAIAIYAEKKDEIALVLTDMMMPVMDGASLIRILRRINPALRIVKASGLYSNGRDSSSPPAGVEYVLTKPYTAEILLKTVRSALDDALPK